MHFISTSNDWFARAEGSGTRTCVRLKRWITVRKKKAIDGEDIGVAFPRWRALKEERGLRADTDVALLLLDRMVFVKHLE